MAASSTTTAPTPIDADREAKSVRNVAPNEHRAVTDVLARAFENDPLMSWMCPDDSRRLRQLGETFAFFADRFWFRHEDLAFTTDGIAGTSLWVAPNEWHASTWQQLRMLPGMLRRLGPRAFARTMQLLGKMDSIHPDERHYYLPIIGVDPAWQGKGLGSALLRPMCERCDREGMPAYLEATSPRNRACYERNGFEVTQEVSVADSPTFFAMWRKPRGG